MNKTLCLFVTLILSAPLAWGAESKKSVPPAAPAAGAPKAMPSPDKAVEKAPDVFKARMSTTKGDFVVEVTRAWSPLGADRFYNLVKLGYFNDIAFFRAVEGFMVQFGIHGLPEVSAKWRAANIKDDASAGQSNKRGTMTYAMAGPNTRTTQIFINYRDNGNLDGMGFTPFGKVVEGMEVVDKLHKGYGDGPPYGRGPEQGRIQMEGNAYLKKDFPQLDYIKSAKLEK
jgi:peptidyl-prolyl cis-trans isomerase A (cyclophilin A)